MIRFTYETNIKDIKELKQELQDIIWGLDHNLPTSFLKQNIDWVKERYEKGVLKVDGGYMRIKIDLEKRKPLKEMVGE